MFYNQFVSLCQMRGVTPSGAADAMSLNRATVTFWKKDGFHPRQSTLEKIASYFQVPVSFLLGEPVSPCPLCGADGPDHETCHRQYLDGARRFGLCWNRALRRQALSQAQEQLSSRQDAQTQTELFQDLARAHFSQSLVLSHFADSHPPFATFRRELLMRPAFVRLLSPEVADCLKLLPCPRPTAKMTAYWPLSPFSLTEDTVPPLSATINPIPRPIPESAVPPLVGSLDRRPQTTLADPMSPSLTNKTATLHRIAFTGTIPVVGHIAAGTPILAEEYIEQYIPTHLPHPEEYFALRVQGDSMTGAGIFSGDLVLIHRQSTAEPGQIVACLVNGEEATLKRFTTSGHSVVLLPENSRYPPLVVHPEDFDTGKAQILGVATEVTHPLL